eukprot:12804427-Alexandrium_andersonii.AAC.1
MASPPRVGVGFGMKTRDLTGGSGKCSRKGSLPMRTRRSISGGLPIGTPSSSAGRPFWYGVSTTAGAARTRHP